jgi:hypothetical protein
MRKLSEQNRRQARLLHNKYSSLMPALQKKEEEKAAAAAAAGGGGK